MFFFFRFLASLLLWFDIKKCFFFYKIKVWTVKNFVLNNNRTQFILVNFVLSFKFQNLKLKNKISQNRYQVVGCAGIQHSLIYFLGVFIKYSIIIIIIINNNWHLQRIIFIPHIIYTIRHLLIMCWI